MYFAGSPVLPVFTTPRISSRGRAGPFFLSLGLHVLIVGSVFLENYLRPPLELRIVAPEQLLADDRYELTWPVFPKDLPPVQPVEQPKPQPAPPAGDGAPPRFRLPQQVVADDPDAASNRQMIWDQAPQVELTQDVRSPNFIEPPMPEVQRPRFEATENQLQAPARRAIADAAPKVQAAAQQANPLESLQTPRLRYWTPETETAAPQRRALAAEAAPEVAAAPGQGLDIGQIQKPTRLRYWTPEQGVNEPGKQALALAAGQAPEISSGPDSGADIAQFQRLSRLRYQQWDNSSGAGDAPARQALDGGGGAPDLGAAPASPAGTAAELVQAQTLASLGSIADPSATTPGRAVVGIDPADDQSAPVPRGQRRGNFAAGPDGGNGPSTASSGSGTGEGDESGAVAAMRVPHLTVTPASPGAPTGAAGAGAPGRGAPEPLNTDRETLLSRFRDATFSPAPAIGVVAPESVPDPESPFPGRAVYTLAVNMPNINSYSGSWIIEFAEIKDASNVAGELQPPSPRLKVDPVYPPAAIDEGIEGDVVLHATIRSDGLVDHIKILKRLDGRLDESAKTALSKWRFYPATKRGVPVDIETVVRIPFRFAPNDPTRR